MNLFGRDEAEVPSRYRVGFVQQAKWKCAVMFHRGRSGFQLTLSAQVEAMNVDGRNCLLGSSNSNFLIPK